MPTNTAEGQYLDPLRKKWLISTQIGSGACGTVHALSKQSSRPSSIEYAVKLAILPPPSTNKKKKKSMVEKNADLLNHENILYRNVLNDLIGTMIPQVPMPGDKGAPTGFGVIDGYRFLVMEKMQDCFSNLAVDLKGSCVYGDIDIGPIAARLLKLMEAIHETQHVFIDVKPENFMLAYAHPSPKRSQKKRSMGIIDTFAERIRIIDFGLMESSKDATKNKHRPDKFPDAQVVGTPLYASLNVLNGHTVSRRDDVEACIYVMVEFILVLMDPSDGSKSMEELALLPWSQAKSDEEIKDSKERAMDTKGEIWNMIGQNGNQELRDGVKTVFDLVRGLDFKEKPDYNKLCRLVAKWKVHVNVNNNASAGAKATSKKFSAKSAAKRKVRSNATSTKAEPSTTVELDVKPAGTSKRVARSSASALQSSQSSPKYDEDVPPTPVTHSSRASRAAARGVARGVAAKEEASSSDDEDAEMISVHRQNDDTSTKSFESALDGSDEMDWEMVTDENVASASNMGKIEKTTQSLRLECIDGPHKGDFFDLTDSLILGSNPSKKLSRGSSKSSIFSVSKDSNASDAHAKLVLNRSGLKKSVVLTIKVFDLKSENGTHINNKLLPKGSYKQAFVKDTIQVGDSVFRVKKN
eukprot:scaffold4843_cov266-Chaetoceros_neogracile.AAC.8